MDTSTTTVKANGSNGHGTTTVTVKPPKTRTQHPANIEVFSIEKEIIEVTLIGTSALIINNFNNKTQTQMEDERRLNAEEKRALKRAPREPVIPEERYMAARILDENGVDCVEARHIKAALVTAATKYGEIGVPGSVVKGALFVLGDLIPIHFRGVKPWVALKPHLGDLKVGPCGLPVMRRDPVRVGNFGSKKPDLRYRPEYRDWSITIRIEFEPALISLAGLHHLTRRAGSSVGLYEWRPEKSAGGIFGRFDIAAASATARAKS
jgi:hypothetical protein